MAKKKVATEKAPSHGATLEEQMFEDDGISERSMTKRSEKVRRRQESKDYLETKMTSKILKEAYKQQKEIENEKLQESGISIAKSNFSAAAELQNLQTLQSLKNSQNLEYESEEEMDYFAGAEYENEDLVGEISAEDEKIMSMFLKKEESTPHKTLSDIIALRIREKEAMAGIVSNSKEEKAERHIPGMDDKVTEVYRGVGQLMKRYTSGKVPKAFKIIPSLKNWEEILYLTEPEAWSAPAIYVATHLFTSNLNARMAQRFFHLVLLPRVRLDIKTNKRLHFSLYQALKKALYKPSAFYKGILLPLCQSRTCNLREAFIIGSVLQKMSIPVLHSSVALLKISEMEYAGTNSYFMKLLLDKKYNLPYRVIDSLISHFLKFMEIEEGKELPVIWHQCFLSFVQRYKNHINEEDKVKLKQLMKIHKHYLLTAEILRELAHGVSRGQNENGTMDLSSVSKVMKTDEVIQDLPAVTISMEED